MAAEDCPGSRGHAVGPTERNLRRGHQKTGQCSPSRPLPAPRRAADVRLDPRGLCPTGRADPRSSRPPIRRARHSSCPPVGTSHIHVTANQTRCRSISPHLGDSPVSHEWRASQCEPSFCPYQSSKVGSAAGAHTCVTARRHSSDTRYLSPSRLPTLSFGPYKAEVVGSIPAAPNNSKNLADVVYTSGSRRKGNR